VKLGRTALVALLVAGCYASPGPSPVGGIEEVIANLVLRGVTVTSSVSGDAGCSDPTLHDNAVHLSVSYQGQSTDLFVLQWRRTSDFDAAAVAFADCVSDFRTHSPGSAVATVEAPPWRAYGKDPTGQFIPLLSAAIREAGGS